MMLVSMITMNWASAMTASAVQRRGCAACMRCLSEPAGGSMTMGGCERVCRARARPAVSALVR
jgi:hypothetical protein